MEDGEAHLVGVAQKVRGEGLIPGRLVRLGLGGGAFDRDLVHIDGHVGLQRHRHLMARHKVCVLEPLGSTHRDLQPAVEHGLG